MFFHGVGDSLSLMISSVFLCLQVALGIREEKQARWMTVVENRLKGSNPGCFLSLFSFIQSQSFL